MYTIDREADTPLYMQIRDRIVRAIESAELTPGDRLPPVSTLAKNIGVTQATIRRALQDLTDNGYTESHVGRGTFIRDHTDRQQKDDGSAEKPSFLTDDPSSTAVSANPLQFASRRLRSGVKKALYDIMPLAHKPGIIQLTRGIPDDKMLPAGFLEEACGKTLSVGSEKFIQATEELGMFELRREIANRFNREGENITPDQVLITNGSLQGITLVAQSLMEKRPKIICETPCFQGISDSFSAMGHWVETVPRDQEGPIIEKLTRFSRNSPQILYLCPYAQNPMGTNLSTDRRKQLISWAKQTGSTIIADEIFKDLIFTNDPPPSILSGLGGDQTVVVSSLSKSIMTGLRLGWVISSAERIKELSQLKRVMDHCAPTFIQGMALTILQSTMYVSHTERMKTVYRERMEAMLHALQTFMPKGVSWSRPTGGFSLLVQLPTGYSSVALLLAAIDRGVSFLPGPLFDIDQRYVHALRLSTAWSDIDQIKEGIELLASTIEEFIRYPPEDSGLSGLGNFQ